MELRKGTSLGNLSDNWTEHWKGLKLEWSLGN
jgi:hypothetical protein